VQTIQIQHLGHFLKYLLLAGSVVQILQSRSFNEQRHEWPEKTGMTKCKKTATRSAVGVVSMPGEMPQDWSAERRAVK
jgi:hypothetical protein